MRDSYASRELFIASFVRGGSSKLMTRAMPALVRAVKDVHLEPGAALFRVGERSSSVFFIASGRVAVVRGANRHTYGERSVVGTSDVVLERSRTQDAIAVTAVHALELPAISWLEILEDNPEAAMNAIVGVAASVDALQQKAGTGKSRDQQSPAPAPEAIPAFVLVDHIMALRSAEAFRHAHVQTLAKLALTADELRLEPGASLIAHDAVRNAHYVVAKGEIETKRGGQPEGRTDRFGPGTLVLGPASFVKTVVCDATATRASVVLQIADEDLFDLCEDHFDLARSIFIWLEEERDLLVR